MCDMRETVETQAQINLAFRHSTTADKLADELSSHKLSGSGFDKMNITTERDTTDEGSDNTMVALQNGGNNNDVERRQLCDLLQSSHVNVSVNFIHDESNF